VKSISHWMVAAAIVSLGVAQHAWADAIVITGGSMLVKGPTASHPELDFVSVRGTRGFSLEARVDPSEGDVLAIGLCGTVEERCGPGATLSLAARGENGRGRHV
jgi:hypothetical protein